mmetsp:Transcript_13691/g.33154  ORF Transcript_13691/g.33154 Transcript_13691/m.33154 type:complete len:472 (+) Transcript_13691:84-1499(+)
MIDSREEDTTSNTDNVDDKPAVDNDPWANDGSILPDMGSQYQLISQLVPGDSNSDDDDSDQPSSDFPKQEESNGISLDIADSLLRGLEEDYRATHARTFATSPPVEVKEAIVNVGQASVVDATDDQNGQSSSLAVEDGDNRNDDTNGDVSFPVHWNDADDADAKPPEAEVDISAVRKTVQDISDVKTSKFMQKYSAWQQKQQQNDDDTHPIIPSAPFQAFQRETDKAKRATASLSRSATIAEALLRCQQQQHESSLFSVGGTHLIVDVVGVDHVECASVARIQETFKPIVRWLGAWNLASLETSSQSKSITTIELRLIGRDLSKSVSAEPIDLLTPNVAKGSSSKMQKATAICFSEICYHDWRASMAENPDLIIAFNAGIWGYLEWAPTLHALGKGNTATPTVITSYTLEEAEEDCESIEEAVAGTAAKLAWGPEPNPFGSKVVRETKSSSREYRENSAWQMWLLGGHKES